MAKPNPQCPACGKRNQKFHWSGSGAPPMLVECPHCEWLWRELPISMIDGCAPWNQYGNPKARHAAEWRQIRGLPEPDVTETVVTRKAGAPVEGDHVGCQPEQRPRSRWAWGLVIEVKEVDGESGVAVRLEDGSTVEVTDRWVKIQDRPEANGNEEAA